MASRAAQVALAVLLVPVALVAAPVAAVADWLAWRATGRRPW